MELLMMSPNTCWPSPSRGNRCNPSPRHVARLSVGCLATPHLGEARVDEIRLDGHVHQQTLETRVPSSKNHPHLLQWEP